jgi:PAS domain S-box-containing protein
MNEKRILIVEDEYVVVLDIQRRLQSMGYTVVGRVASGEAAVEKAVETRPDLVLMDIRLKGEMDGVEAAEQIQSRYNIPVIYLTAYADDAILQRAKLTAPYGYLIKPFEDRELQIIIEMAIYRSHLERELKENRQWLSTTLSSIGDAVIATDNQGRIKFMNPVAEILTGWKQAEALGKDSPDVFRIVNDQTQQPIESPVAKVLQEGCTIELEDNTLLITRDGRKIPIDENAAPIAGDNGQTDGVVLVFRDITQRKQAEAKVHQYNLQLQQQNAELDAFAHTVARDLKAPLNSMVGFAELSNQPNAVLSSDDLRAYQQAIVRNGRKMVNIIEELLLLTEVRKASVKVKPLKMAGIVVAAQRRLASMIEEYQAKIMLPKEWPEAVGYAPWVEEVWVNFLSNGLKYGGRPPCLELGGAVQANGNVCFWIRDNGPGLSSEAQDQLFAPFTQLELVRAAGHGLGLTIVQRIVERLGGRVGVVSKGVPGYGSIF